MTATDLITDPSLLSVLAAATEARKQCLDLITLLDARGTSQLPPDDDEAFQSERKLNARLAILRSLNRKAVMGVRSTKGETSEKRQEIDSLHLQLQNLYYEQRHLHGEIRGCEEFEHKYQTLPMIPVEEFMALHPEYADVDDHELTIARIKDEHVARQTLENQRLELVKRKDALLRETTAKKDELNKLDSEFEKWYAGQENVRKIFEAREKKAKEADEKAQKAAAAT